MDHTWIDSSFDVDGRHIGISVKRIDQQEAERLVAALAWFGAAACAGPSALDGSEWPATLQFIFSNYIALTMEERAVQELDIAAVSTAVCAAALGVFIRVNGLGPSIVRHISPQLSCDDVGRSVH